MKRKDLRDAYAYYSGKTSDISRQLAFAGIAVVWLFKTGLPQSPALPSELLAPLVFFGLALGLDLMHYVVSAAIWGTYNRYKEHQRAHISEDASFDAPLWMNWPGLVLYYCKLAAVLVAHCLLVGFIASQWLLFG